ncbi:Gfo/Idh/MocA family oxidoreductase [Fervidicoccus fontis]|uniref:Gfo/Idh/MocA family oxidoreductase n=2 Tax=Fervidicoccus fontis TaxID=683846 RepID=A0A2J6N9U5_9CREN|nr:Gfo/Idh/MocA family oxidoreductase [Fervidicoccus fontis]MBE9391000.1 Gfo/Idh/MocA family oxidoreductase [Fervidicoccus fontis]PMB75509.1 MAG: hypothetical protein C0188_02935 [Fervidicoccus fontis]PMB78064.1 MAG: hypothetical protein C0177_01375 [Fervidicoccus fontis]HEW64214.1 Gfo/Idh/MocA family oxidoreductase [Fervidicoccus fontis]
MEKGIGIIGAGYMGQAHIRVLSEIAKKYSLKITFVVEPDINKGMDISAKYQLRYYQTLSEAIKNEENFIAFVSSPTSTHLDYIDELLSNGIEYIFVEKPLGSDINRAKEIFKKYGRNVLEKVMVGHIERFNPAFVEFKKIVKEESVLGDPISITSRRVGPFAGRIRDTGVILDLAIHDIDLSLSLFDNEPKGIDSYKYNVYSKEYEDSCFIILNYGKFLHFIEANRVTPYKERKAIFTGTKGIGIIDYMQQSLEVFTGLWKMERSVNKREPLAVEDEAFLNAVIKKEKVPVTFEDGIRSLEIALKALEIAKNNNK